MRAESRRAESGSMRHVVFFEEAMGHEPALAGATTEQTPDCLRGSHRFSAVPVRNARLVRTIITQQALNFAPSRAVTVSVTAFGDAGDGYFRTWRVAAQNSPPAAKTHVQSRIRSNPEIRKRRGRKARSGVRYRRWGAVSAAILRISRELPWLTDGFASREPSRRIRPIL